MSELINRDRRTFLGNGVVTVAAAQLLTSSLAHARPAKAKMSDLTPIKPGTSVWHSHGPNRWPEPHAPGGWHDPRILNWGPGSWLKRRSWVFTQVKQCANQSRIDRPVTIEDICSKHSRDYSS
jgi:hypothetical protein